MLPKIIQAQKKKRLIFSLIGRIYIFLSRRIWRQTRVLEKGSWEGEYGQRT